MNYLHNAIKWNIISLPIKVILGIVSTSLISKICLASEKVDLQMFAFLNATSTTLILITSFGMPQLFSRLAASSTDRRSKSQLFFLLKNTLIVRAYIWVACLAIFTFTYFTYPISINDITSLPLLTICLFWILTISNDTQSFTGRALNSAFEQKWQSIIQVFAQLLGIVILTIGMFLQKSNGLTICLLSVCIASAVKLFAQIIVVERTIKKDSSNSETKIGNLKCYFNSWGELSLLVIDKYVGYLFSSSFLILTCSAYTTSKQVATLFLTCDLAAKAIALLSAPLSGILIPLLSHSENNIRINEKIKKVILTICLVIPVAFLIIILTFNTIFSNIFHFAPNLGSMTLSLVLITMIIEFCAFELSGSFALIRQKLKKFLILKMSVAVIYILSTASMFYLTDSTELILTIGFMTRLLSASTILLLMSQKNKELI